MIQLDEARRRVQAALASDDEPVAITHEHEMVEGWLFCFQSLRYLQSGEISDALAGNGPIFVDRHTGEQHALGTTPRRRRLFAGIWPCGTHHPMLRRWMPEFSNEKGTEPSLRPPA